MKKNYIFTLIFALLTSLTFGQIVINEVDADQTGTDTEEFIELLWTPNTSLDGYVVVLFNGSNDTSYAAYDLDDKTTDENGLFVLATTSIASGTDIDMGSDNKVQNGADAIAIYQANDTDFPNGTSVTTTGLIDAIVYGTSDGDDSGLLTSFGLSIQYDEDLNGNKDIESIQRKSDGTYEVKEPSRRVLSVLRNEIQGFATYPNPVTNNIFAVKSNSADTKQVSIFNVLGKRVLSSSITGVQADIDVSSISAGLYILKVTEGTKTATSKLVIR